MYIAHKFAFRCSLPTTLTGTQIACNLQSTCSLQHYNFSWHTHCLQFAIRCSLTITSTGIQIAYHLLSTCSLQNHFNWHSNCLQFAIHCSCLQLQLAYQLPVICTPLLFAYNFQRYSKARNLQSVCSWPTNTTSLQMPAMCNLFARCLQLLLAFKLPANLQSFCSFPTTTISQLDSRTCICFVHNASER